MVVTLPLTVPKVSPRRSTQPQAANSMSQLYWHASTSSHNGMAISAPTSPVSLSHSLSPPDSTSSLSTLSSSSGSSYAGSRSASPTSPQLPNKTDNEREAWSALQNTQTGDVLRSVLRVRKTWKTARGGETVWPLDLESALLEGLERYVPDDSRETRMLGRFPRRNRFISDYILRKTGKHRTPKQVGSRLQQLRESCGGKKLLHLLSPFREPPPSPGSDAGSSLGSPTPSPCSFLDQATAPHTTMYIDIVPSHLAVPSTASLALPDAQSSFHASPYPRRISQINPLSTFTSPAPLSAHARFSVLSESAGLVLHAETVPLELLADAPESGDVFAAGLYYYSAKIVPRYWNVIVDSPDPTRFTIFQEIVKDDSAASVLFTATYRFCYPPQAFGSPSIGPAMHLPVPDLDIDLGLGPELGFAAARESGFRSTMTGTVGAGWGLH